MKSLITANRQNSYDIISQKQSDATLGYEHVYDTETNEIYKAYNAPSHQNQREQCTVYYMKNFEK